MIKLFNGSFFNYYFVICLILMLLPTIFHWEPIISALEREKLPIYYALESAEYKISLYSSLAVSCPMLLQLFSRILMDHSVLFSFYKGISNIILVMWIISTDVIILWVVIPERDLITYNSILYLRVISLVWSVGIYLYLYSESSIWHSQLTVGAFISIITTRVISYYDIYFNIPYLLQQINSIFVAACYIVLFVQGLRWFVNARKIYKTKQMSMKETLCGIYIISMLGATISAFFVFGYYMDALWYQSDSYNLCAQTGGYTIFYVIFTVFQGSAYEREAQTSKVIYFNYFKYGLFIFISTNVCQVALEVKQLFIRYISHEMRTPLNTVMMGLQHLKEEIAKPGSDKMLVYKLEVVVEEIQDSCDVALRTLNDMLLHDKIENGSLAIEAEDIRVIPLLQDVVKELQLQVT